MGDPNEIMRPSKGTENLSLQTDRFQRDLLQRFVGKKSEFGGEKEGDEGEIELNLGLSLGGRFGVDKSDNRLMRSSSIAGSLPVVRDDDVVAAPPPMGYQSLMRTSSLPVETEAEWRKRKELQTLRRMEAKKRRTEKQRNKDTGTAAAAAGGGGGGAGSGGFEEREQYFPALNRSGSGVILPVGISTLAAVARQAFVGGGIDVGKGKGKGNSSGGGGGSGCGANIQGFVQLVSQRSIDSQWGSSSSMSELESKHLHGSSGEVSPASIQSLQEKSNKEVVGSSGAKKREHTSRTIGAETENASKRAVTLGNRGKEIGMNSLQDMPCVFTKGDGPNGRRIEGILYKYGKGEDVRIMCVCHGKFLSPAEFVKHAGGADVAHPLKHIVVNPNASFSV